MLARSQLSAASVAAVGRLLDCWERLDRGWKASVLGAGVVVGCLLL